MATIFMPVIRRGGRTRPHSAGPELLPWQHSCQVKILLQHATGMFYLRPF